MKTLQTTFTIFSLALALMLSGCVTKIVEVPVYIEAQCPNLELMEKVPALSGYKDENGCVCGPQLQILLEGATDLRRSETFYYEQAVRFNEEYSENSLDK